MGDNGSTDPGQTQEGTSSEDSGGVTIKRSETGSDPDVGHTPGKAEGVSDPEDRGNE